MSKNITLLGQYITGSVSSRKVGEAGVCAGGEAARTHPAPRFIEMIRRIRGLKFSSFFHGKFILMV